MSDFLGVIGAIISGLVDAQPVADDRSPALSRRVVIGTLIAVLVALVVVVVVLRQQHP